MTKSNCRLRVLLVEDSEDDALLGVRALERAGHEVTFLRVDTGPDLADALDEEWDVVICDYAMPEFSGPEALRMVRERSADMPFVVISGVVGEEAAVEMMREGAHDFLLKSNLVRLVPAVRRELAEAGVRREKRAAELALAASAARLEDQKHRLEEALDDLAMTAEDLCKSNAELEQFANVASHDLREPLRMIGSYVGLLNKRYGDKLGDDADEFVGYILGGVSRMKALIDGLAAYSRVGEVEARTDVDCGELVRGVVKDLAPQSAEAGACITVAGLPTVSGCPGQLAELFMNLISNGIKFSSESPPKIEVCAVRAEGASEEIPDRAPAGGWLFSVRDNGIGFDPEYRDSIFDAFYRLQPKDLYPGTGIGLAICRRIVRNHGGTIWCRSSPGKGSAFHFTLPCSQ